MAVVLAIAVSAIVVGLVTAVVTARLARGSINKAIGGRAGADPIDEHRRLLAEAERQTARETSRADLLRLSLDVLTSGVIVTDHAGRVLVRNRLAEAASPRTHEQLLVDATAAELLARAVQGHTVEREVEIFGPPQRILFVHAVPVNSNAQVVGALAVIEDVTDTHRTEKTRRDFIANLSHELRTPVGAVSLLAEMLVDEPDPETRQHLTERLMIEADRMTDTIDGLLELSRIESGPQDYDDTIVVQQLVDEAVARVRVTAEAAGVDVGVVGPTEPIVMLGSRNQLLVALVNLVENAVKYSAQGSSVSVRTRVEGGALSLVVQDTGRGIPARDLDRIFERFYRVDRAREGATGGTGIGLSIVRHVALNHGGRVSVESFEGEGSTFTLHLPLVAPNSDNPAETATGVA